MVHGPRPQPEAQVVRRSLRDLPWAWLLALVASGLGLSLTLIAAGAVHSANTRSMREYRADFTVQSVQSLDRRIDAFVDVLHSASALFRVEATVTRQQFEQYLDTLDLENRYSGVQVIGVADLLTPAERSRRVEEISGDAARSGLPYPDFAVHPTPADNAEVLVIDYLYPPAGNENAFGLDFFSESARRGAAVTARDSGRASATAPITLVQETADQQAFLVMVPLYDRARPTETVAQRQAAFRGVVYSAFRIDDLIQGTAGPLAQAGRLEIRDLDATGNAEAAVLYDRDARAALRPGRTVDPAVLTVAGRRWSILAEPRMSGISPLQSRLPWIILALGFTITALTVSLGRHLLITRSRAESTSRGRGIELRTTSRLLQSVLQAATGVSIIATDTKGLITVFNSGAEQLLGYRSGEIVQRQTPALFHDPAEVAARAAELGIAPGFEVFVQEAKAGGTGTREWTYLRRDATRRIVELTVTGMRDDGDLVGFIGIARDITDRRKAEEEQENLRESFRLLLECSAQGIYGIDLDGRCTFVNHVGADLLGHSREDLLGANMHELMHHTTVQGRAYAWSECRIQAAINENRPVTAVKDVFWRSDGSPLPVEYSVGAIIRNGHPEGAAVTFTDISERLVTEAALRAALKHERESVVQQQGQFRSREASVSHEFRATLIAIMDQLGSILSDGERQAHHDFRQDLSVAQIRVGELLALLENPTEGPLADGPSGVMSSDKPTSGPLPSPRSPSITESRDPERL